MERQRGKDLHRYRDQVSLLPLLDPKHLKSIISFRVGRSPVGAASIRDGAGEGSFTERRINGCRTFSSGRGGCSS